MPSPTLTPDDRFELLVEEFLGTPGVDPPTTGRGFGASGLKVHNKIFAMLSGGKLVVKLPKARVDALVADDMGERFDPRRDGRVMREWLTIDSRHGDQWMALAQEALDYVGGR